MRSSQQYDLQHPAFHFVLDAVFVLDAGNGERIAAGGADRAVTSAAGYAVTDGSLAANPVMGVTVTFETTLARVSPGQGGRSGGDGMAVLLGSSQAQVVTTQDGLASIVPSDGSVGALRYVHRSECGRLDRAVSDGELGNDCSGAAEKHSWQGPSCTARAGVWRAIRCAARRAGRAVCGSARRSTGCSGGEPECLFGRAAGCCFQH